MKNFHYLILVSLMFLLPEQSDATETKINTLFTNSPEIISQIESVIFEKYIGGQLSGNPEVIKDAFSPDAVMLAPDLVDEDNHSLSRWLDMHAEADSWGASANTNLDINEVKILKLDIIDERLATAQIKMEDRVYEVVTLVKIKDSWKIASKVYIPQL